MPVVVTANGSSASFNVNSQQFAPAFFTWPGSQPVATRQDFSWAVKPGTFASTATMSAKAGDVIILWGTGFGPTVPAAPIGVPVPPNNYSTSNPVTVTVGGISAQVYGAALSPGLAGVYQIAIQIPPSLQNGEYPVMATVAGAQTPVGNATISIQN